MADGRRGRGRPPRRGAARYMNHGIARNQLGIDYNEARPRPEDHRAFPANRSNLGPGRRQRTYPMGWKALEALLEEGKTEDDVLTTLLSPQSGFTILLQMEEIRRDLMTNVLRATSKAMRTPLRQTAKIELLNYLQQFKTFVQNVNQYILNIPKHPRQKMMSKIAVVALLEIFQNLLEKMPKSFELFLPCTLVLRHVMVEQADEMPEVFDSEIESLLEKLDTYRKNVTKIMIEKAKQNTRKFDDPVEEPPDNFREISVFPTVNELLEDKQPYLRKNKEKGRFTDLNHYLDVQFRLLREDFFSPLRNGIKEYLELVHTPQRLKTIRTLRVYTDVQLISPECTETGMMYKFHFSTEKLNKVRWESSKRFIFGALVILSRDNFQTMIMATVQKRDVKDLQKGLIVLNLLDKENIPSLSDSLVLVETLAYFEAYKHTLLGLQETDAEFPFQKYIVRCEKEQNTPRYLQAFTRYDLSPLIDSSLQIEKRALNNVPILDKARWPSPNLLKLDESQAKALQMALSKEFSVIQGPPGTGKTYVGLKIVHALLHNKTYCTVRKSPILVVCYTNHALDQFLEGILDLKKDNRLIRKVFDVNAEDSDSDLEERPLQNRRFQNIGSIEIIRVGGRSKNERIMDRSLNKIKSELRRERKVPEAIYHEIGNVKSSMADLRTAIETIGIRLETSSKGLLKLRLLDDYLSEHQVSSIHEGFYNRNPFQVVGKHINILSEWLGLGETPQEPVILEENAENAKEEEEDDDETIDVEEEASLLSNLREDEVLGKNSKKKKVPTATLR